MHSRHCTEHSALQTHSGGTPAENRGLADNVAWNAEAFKYSPWKTGYAAHKEAKFHTYDSRCPETEQPPLLFS